MIKRGVKFKNGRVESIESDAPTNFLELYRLFLFLSLKDFYRHVIYGGIVEYHYAAIGTRFNVNTTVLAKFIVASAKIIADSLCGCIELVGDAAD